MLGLFVLAGACGSPQAPAGRTPPASAPRTAPDPAPPPRADGRLPGGVVPTGYHLDLTVDPRQKSFLGHVRIAVRVEQPTRAIVMHARGITVHLASIEQAGQKLWTKPRARFDAHGKVEPEELVLAFDRELSPGEARLDIEYEAAFGTTLRGLYRVEEAGQAYAFTQFEPMDARRAFPCFDEPGYKVPFELAVSVPAGMTAVSNTPLAGQTEQPESGLWTYRFEPSRPLPTYLVALGVGAFDVLEAKNAPVPLRLLAVKGRAALGELALETATEHLALLAGYFGSAYPYQKLDLLAVPNFASGAMENAGLVTFREELLLLDPKQASTTARRAMANVVAHELAHHWFGNLVTMAWWDDLWLNEAFATWMAAKIVDQAAPELGLGHELLARKLAVMANDSLQSARKIRQPVRSTSEALEAFDGITYVKGAGVLGMVEHWLGAATFQSGVRSYLIKHAWKNATSEDLFSALGAASGKDVASVMNSFVDQTGVPEVTAGLACAGRAKTQPARVELGQSEYRLLGSPGQAEAKHWRLPVCVVGPSPGRAEQCWLFDQKSGEVELGAGCPAWIFANAGAAGYYRVRLDAAELAALARVSARGLTERERTALLGDAWALVHSGALGVDAYLDTLTHFAREPNAVVWEQISEALFRIERTLVSEAGRALFARRVSKLVSSKARELGFQAAGGELPEQRMLRRTLLLLAGLVADDAWAAEQAKLHAQRWIADPVGVDSDIAIVALRIHGRSADAAWFDALLARLPRAQTPEQRLLALTGLTSIDDPKLIERLLYATLDGTIKAQDTRYVFRPLFERRAAGEVAHRWLVAHFDELSRKLPGSLLARTLSGLGNFCEDVRAKEIEAYFRPRLSRVEGAEKYLNQALENVRLCSAMAAHQAPRLARWLDTAGQKRPAQNGKKL